MLALKKYLTNSSADSVSTLSTKLCTAPTVCLSINVDLAELNSRQSIELVKSSSFPCVGAAMTRKPFAGLPTMPLNSIFKPHISAKSKEFLAFWYF